MMFINYDIGLRYYFTGLFLGGGFKASIFRTKASKSLFTTLQII